MAASTKARKIIQENKFGFHRTKQRLMYKQADRVHDKYEIIIVVYIVVPG